MNNVLVNCDTDSAMIAKVDGSPWTKEERTAFLDALNAQFPSLIRWEDDGYYDRVLVSASKNYALLLNPEYADPNKDFEPDGKVKIKTKGSSIRDQKKEPALREMMDKMIYAMIHRQEHTLVSLYQDYVKEALNIQNVDRWCAKKTVTESITDCKGYTQKDIDNKKLRKNETDIWDTIKNEEGVQQGDKIYIYPVILENKIIPGGVSEKTGKQLKDKVVEVTGFRLRKYWNNDHDVQKLVDRVYKTVSIFKAVLNMNDFTDYSATKYYKMVLEGKPFEEIDLIYKEDEKIKAEKKAAKALKDLTKESEDLGLEF